MVAAWRALGAFACAGTLLNPAFAQQSDAETDALSLQSAPSEKPLAAAAERPLRLYVEGTLGRMSQRYGLPNETVRRASVDLNWNAKLGPQWRAVISNRLDDMHPVDLGERSTLNSLREAYVGWRDAGGSLAADLGRVNLRYGPAYGFNPTDFFRDGSQRVVTSVDPIAQRENRLGTVMLHAQRFWTGGSASVSLAPKLDDTPSRETFSLDLGSTNHATRVLFALGMQPSDKVSAQLLLYHERDKGTQLGASGTALLGDSTVAFVEWAGGRDHELLSALTAAAPRVVTRHRAVAGMTYTTPQRLSLTFEVEYNGFAPDDDQWRGAQALGEEFIGAYLTYAQRRQDLASRQAVLLYATQRDAFVKNLEWTALLRVNTKDRSRFSWLEARYHLPKIDVALQLQFNSGRPLTEYGVVPGRRVWQALAAYYF